MRILVVDDDAGLREQLKTSLIRQRYEVDGVCNGEEALDRLFESLYDLIVLDIMLPKKDGLVVLKELRKAGISTPVIMLTTEASRERRLEAMKAGANDCAESEAGRARRVARLR